MAVIKNHLTNGKGGGASSFNTASFTPSGNKLILVVVLSDNNSGSGNDCTVTGKGLTWTEVGTKQNTVQTAQRVSVFRAMGDATAGALTIDFGGQTQTSVFWGVTEFEYVSTDGSGAGAIVQFGSVDAGVTDPLNMNLVLNAFESSNNATFVAAIGPDAFATPSGFSSVWSDVQDLGPDNNVSVFFRVDPSTTTNFSSTGSGANVATAVGVEIRFSQGNDDDYADFM